MGPERHRRYAMKMDWRSMRIAVTLLTLGLTLLAIPPSLGFVEGLAHPGGNHRFHHIRSRNGEQDARFALGYRPPTSSRPPCYSIPTPLLVAGNIISMISRLLPDPPECSRSPQALRAMPKL